MVNSRQFICSLTLVTHSLPIITKTTNRKFNETVTIRQQWLLVGCTPHHIHNTGDFPTHIMLHQITSFLLSKSVSKTVTTSLDIHPTLVGCNITQLFNNNLLSFGEEEVCSVVRERVRGGGEASLRYISGYSDAQQAKGLSKQQR